jgi:hypothetical protein
LPTYAVAARRPQHRQLPAGVRQLRARHQGLGTHLDGRPRPCRGRDSKPPAGAEQAQQKGGKIEPVWAFPPDKEPNPYQVEWDDLLAAIRNDKPYNEVKRGAEASLVTAMGRMACHTGRPVTYEQALNHADKYELGPDVDQLTMESPPPAPARADKDGKYGIPQPGSKVRHELPVNDRG